MKKTKTKRYIIALIMLVFIIFTLLNHYMSYSMRIGDTRFFLLETMAMSKDGKPLLGLYCEVMGGGYKGVEMRGFPRHILWNEDYLISKNYDGNDTTITNYVVINQDSVNLTDGNISGLRDFKAEADYINYVQQIGLSESKMKQIDNHITWWKMLFMEIMGYLSCEK